MKPIRIFTPDMQLLAVIGNYESLIFTRSFHGIGPLDLRINRHKNFTHHLQNGNVIVVGEGKEGDHKAFEILHREIELDENGKASENWLIVGRQTKSVTEGRLVLPPSHTSNDNKSGNAELVMKHYVNNHLANPSDPNRKDPLVILAPNLNRGKHIDWQLRWPILSDELESMSLISGLGWNVRANQAQGKWVFDVNEGRDLTQNNTDDNSPVIFSPQLGNVKNMQYVDSILNLKNVAYVAGQGEGVDRRVIQIGTATGHARREMFVDARDVSEETDVEGQDPTPRPVADIIADLKNRGEQKLAEMIQETFLEAQIMTHSNFKYEEDWDLGDLVTVQYLDWGVTLDARITEVKEIYEPGGFQIEATFGNSRPTLISKIKQELSGMRNEIVR